MVKLHVVKINRRKFIALAGVAGAGVLVQKYISGGVISISPPTSSQKTKEVTPNSEFYLTHYDGVPKVDMESWRLTVTGEVDAELSLDLDDIKALSDTVDYNTLICIGNGIGGSLIGNAEWRGIRLKDVLAMAGLKDSARDLVFHGADGYADSFPVERGLSQDTRLVYEMNGETLPEVHGFPLRAVVPGLYGIKNVKWIERIEVTSEDFRGYWQKRGWNEEGLIKVMSRIDSPKDGDIITEGAYEISGVSFAGEYPITRVEVSTDGGWSWVDAKLKPSLSRFAWTLWSFDWKVPVSGDHEIAVRASDESGRIQQEGSIVSRRVFPDGADGYHKIKVKTMRI
jgi:DMSO/TMAO reductase YedYZ molybdopterin-dependent catalytic subunit